MFLEWWNTTKSLSTIWKCFSCLLDEGIAKICNKLKCHSGFLSYLEDRTANPANLAAIICHVLICPKKAIVGIQFLVYFCSPLVKIFFSCHVTKNEKRHQKGFQHIVSSSEKSNWKAQQNGHLLRLSLRSLHIGQVTHSDFDVFRCGTYL